MPGARSTRSLVRKMKKHTSVVTTVTPETPGIPRAMGLTVSFVLSPVTGLVCHRRPRKLPFANLMPASGHQDHTALPSASGGFVLAAIRVHRIPPYVRDVAQRPSKWDGTATDMQVIWPRGQGKIRKIRNRSSLTFGRWKSLGETLTPTKVVEDLIAPIRCIWLLNRLD